VPEARRRMGQVAGGQGGCSGQSVTMHVRVVIPMRTYSKLNERVHWSRAAKIAKHERREAYFRMREAHPFVLSLLDIMGPIQIKLTRTGPSRLDDDNLVSSFKNVRDGIADWLKIDDGDPRLVFSYDQERHARWRVIVEIEGPDKARDTSMLNPRAAWPFPEKTP